MAYVVKSKITGMFLVRGKDEFEVYWSNKLEDATQFKTAQEVCEYLSGWQIEKVDILCPSEVISAPAPLTLGNLPEGKKFQYADQPNGYTFMKVLQPYLDNFNTDTRSFIGDSDGRYYLHLGSDNSWVIILDNNGDTHPQVSVGRIILLNNGILVREVQ